MKKIFTLLVIMFPVVMLYSQSTAKFNIESDKVLYTVGYAHLDTEWNWDYPTTINVCIRNTMEENFRLFEKYPNYVFNFTGSRRYKMMKEYYPELYQKVVYYVNKGRWHVSGSSVDEGEVNVSSPESVIRQVLYGNSFFKKEFNKQSYDYMLPDCFGFQANMPSIWNHAGLLGFSTQKLTWRGAVPIPFNVGVWNGPDGKGVIAAINATSYVGRIENRLDNNESWNKRLDENFQKYGISFDYRYYGVGDEGGAPRENDVINAEGSINNSDSKIKVVLASSDQLYKDITPEIRKKLPVYSGDLLLIEHSAGSQTSQAYMKRMNRKNELLAYASEQAAFMASWLGGASYPYEKINNSWDLILGSQFHDILPGTSIPKAYEYAWNDEFIAENNLYYVLENSIRVISDNINTNTKGKPLVVYNPLGISRSDVVTAELEFENKPEQITVYDKNNKPLKTQIIERKDNKVKFIFLATLPSTGISVFDVREEKAKSDELSTLKVSSNSLENDFYKIKIAGNGDIESIFDKKLRKEILSQPARLEFLKEEPADWPSWNMDWKDRQKPAFETLDKEANISILENGPVRVSLLVTRKGLNSEIEQIVSLSAGDAGKRVEVDNTIDWQSKEVSLKAAFPLAVSNENATYNLGVGTIQRGNNTSNKFEVPSREWFDLTDKSGSNGVTIIEDCKYGSDKPSDNTLRLTLLYTPKVSDRFSWCWYQGTQDWGIHRVKYAIYSHKGSWVDGQSTWQAKFVNQPLIAFETKRHDGSLGNEYSLIQSSSPNAGIMAVKKAESSDYLIVRLNELSGQDNKGMTLSFPTKIVDAFEVDGQENKIGTANFKNTKLTYDLSHYTIKSFAVKLASNDRPSKVLQQEALQLPYNYDWISFDNNRFDCNNGWGSESYPAEMFPKVVTSQDINFSIENIEDRKNNVLEADGQVINLPNGNFTKLYILAAATKDSQGDFYVDDQKTNLKIQSWRGFIGQFYNRIMNELDRSIFKVEQPFYKPDNIAWYSSHYHQDYPSANKAYQYCYLYKYEIDIPLGAKTLKLPTSKDIRIFAATIANSPLGEIKKVDSIIDDFKDAKNFELRK